MTISAFLEALASEAPPAELAKDMELYGWLSQDSRVSGSHAVGIGGMLAHRRRGKARSIRSDVEDRGRSP
jgi:hypothetical protein